jgi:hypothetical protein
MKLHRSCNHGQNRRLRGPWRNVLVHGADRYAEHASHLHVLARLFGSGNGDLARHDCLALRFMREVTGSVLFRNNDKNWLAFGTQMATGVNTGIDKTLIIIRFPKLDLDDAIPSLDSAMASAPSGSSGASLLSGTADGCPRDMSSFYRSASSVMGLPRSRPFHGDRTRQSENSLSQRQC